MKICYKCFNVGDCQCERAAYFDVDDQIAELISILNKKGYYTQFCCAGHPVKEDLAEGLPPDLYIKFTDKGWLNLFSTPDFMKKETRAKVIRLKIVLKDFLRYIPNVPKKYQTLQSLVNDTLVDDIENYLEEHRQRLLDWAKGLPYFEYDIDKDE